MVRNLNQLAQAINGGANQVAHWRKVPSQASTAGGWVDFSMAAGNPVPNYYAAAPLIAKRLDGWDGILHGDAKSPAEKYLYFLEATTPTANLLGTYKLLDYLLFYPFIDLDSTDEQTMDNTITLPRYADGEGVMAMFVCAAPTIGNGSFRFNYINSAGESRTAPLQYFQTGASNIATLLNSQPASDGSQGPFLNLLGKCTGIRQITSVTVNTSNGGLGTIVLVQPIAEIQITEINCPSEVLFLRDNPVLPRIYDGAYLHFIANTAGSVSAGIFTGRANFTWVS